MFSNDTPPLATSSQPIPYARVLELLADDHNLQKLEEVTKALGSETRLVILRFLSAHTCTLLEIAEADNLPPSTATLHINVLEKAGLIETDLRPATRGLQKVCARVYDRIVSPSRGARFGLLFLHGPAQGGPKRGRTSAGCGGSGRD